MEFGISNTCGRYHKMGIMSKQFISDITEKYGKFNDAQEFYETLAKLTDDEFMKMKKCWCT